MSDNDRPRADNQCDGGIGQERTEAGKSEESEKKGKNVPLFLLRKGKKLLDHKKKREGIAVKSGFSWRKARRSVGGGGCFCLCLKEPQTLDSSGESPTSDPNSSEFTFDMLRALIEKNDFYSRECNPHLDADD